MKKKLLGILLLIAAMVCIPMLTVHNNAYSDVKTVFSENNKKDGKLIELLAGNYRDEYSEEMLKALVIILNSNYITDKSKFSDKDFMDKDTFIKKYGENKYSILKKTVKKYGEKTIKYKGKTVYTPIFYLSDGYTLTSEKYPHLSACACPWDKLNNKFEECGNVNGISLNSLNVLCKKGASYKEALGLFIN